MADVQQTLAPSLLVRLAGEHPEAWADALANGHGPVRVVGPKGLFTSAWRGELRDQEIAIMGEPPSAGIGASITTLATAVLRPRAVVDLDVRDGRAVSRSLGRHLASTALPASWQFAVSAVAVAAQRRLAKMDLAPRLERASSSPELERVVYLRPMAGIPSRTGGSVTHSHGVIRALEQIGRKVEPFTTDPYIVDTAGSQHDPPCVWTLVDISTGWKAVPASTALGGDLALLRAAIAAAQRSQLVYQRHHRFSLGGALLARAASRPLFLEYNGPEGFFDQAWHDSPLGVQLEMCEESCLRAATRIIVNSQVDLESLQARGISRNRLVFSPNGVEVERFGRGGGPELRGRLHIAPQEVLLGFIGSFGAWHGATVLAEAFCGLREAGLPVRLLLVGDGPERANVESLIRARGSGHQTIFAGDIRPDLVPQYLDACDVLVSPHVPLPGGADFFGSPTKVFEYMAAGKAIAASRLGQIGQVLRNEETALLVPPRDVRHLTAALARLADDRELRERLARAARDVAIRCHSWRNNAQHVVDAYADWQAEGSP